MPDIALHTDNLSIGYKYSIADHLHLDLYSGEVTTLIGANGIGKSTLMRTLCGDLKPLNGNVSILNKSISSISPRQLARKLAIVDTSTGMIGGLRVHECVELGRQPYTGLFGLLQHEDKEKCIKAMEQTGISYKADAYMSELSDGERQKAMIARALAQDTPLLFLDEPFSFLDPAGRLEIMALLTDIANKEHKAILLTCHDVALSLRMANKLWLFLRNGKLLSLTPQEALTSGVLEQLYDSDKVVFSARYGDYIIKKHINNALDG